VTSWETTECCSYADGVGGTSQAVARLGRARDTSTNSEEIAQVDRMARSRSRLTTCCDEMRVASREGIREDRAEGEGR
jgi:hypothetical protein